MLWPLNTELTASGSRIDLYHSDLGKTVFTHSPGLGGTFYPLFKLIFATIMDQCSQETSVAWMIRSWEAELP